MTTANPTAAILLIGNEILSGKVEDENARFLTRELRALGVALRRIEVVPDVTEEIADSVRALSPRFDVRVHVGRRRADARRRHAAGRRGRLRRWSMVRHPELEALLRAGYGDRPARARPAHGRHPGGRAAGVRARRPGGSARPWPVVVVRNVWVLPGVPSIFRRKFEAVRELFRAGPIHGRAPVLARRRGPHRRRARRGGRRVPGGRDRVVPHPEAPDYRVKITLDGRDGARVDAALAWLAARLGEAFVRTD